MCAANRQALPPLPSRDGCTGSLCTTIPKSYILNYAQRIQRDQIVAALRPALHPRTCYTLELNTLGISPQTHSGTL